MDVQAWDSVFVRARRVDVHPVVADLAGWQRWWPGLRSVTDGDVTSVTLRPPGLVPRRQRFAARVTKDRAARSLGVDLRYTGDITGEAELYYLDEPTGTVVHYLLRAAVAEHRWRRVLADHRASVRHALEALKERFEVGRLPGEEPDPALLAAQAEAIREFQAGVEAWVGKQAAEGRTP